MKKQLVIRWSLCPLALAWVAHARGATIVVPTDQPTIQAAVDAASPGDTIQVQPGSYQESVRIRGANTGLTIEAADATDPPTIHGTPNKSVDGIRVDSVDGVIFRNLRIVGAYDGVRLNSVRNAIVVGLDIENSALGIRVNHGQGTIVDRCIVLGTRVEQGILVASASGTLIRGSTIGDTDREGIRVVGSPGVVLENDLVSGSRSADGIAVGSSPGVEIDGCVVSDSSGDGIHVTNSAGLVLSGNSATDNLEIGLSISRSPPFRSVADVIAAGNSASGNREAEIEVSGGSGTTSATIAGGTTTSSTTTSTTAAGSTITTSTTRAASTTTTSTATAGSTTTLVAPRGPSAVEILRPDCPRFRGCRQRQRPATLGGCGPRRGGPCAGPGRLPHRSTDGRERRTRRRHPPAADQRRLGVHGQPPRGLSGFCGCRRVAMGHAREFLASGPANFAAQVRTKPHRRISVRPPCLRWSRV